LLDLCESTLVIIHNLCALTGYVIGIPSLYVAFPTYRFVVLFATQQTLQSFFQREVHNKLLGPALGVVTITIAQITNIVSVIWSPDFFIATDTSV